MAEVARELRERLDQWMRETNDPLLQGPVPPPKGARINSSDSKTYKEPALIIE